MGKKQYLADDIASDLGLIEPKQSKADLIANDLGLNKSPDINLSNNLTLEPQASPENKVRDILKSVDSSDAEKEYIVGMATKGANQNEISDAILTIQGKHPKQQGLSGTTGYYLEDNPRGYKSLIPVNGVDKIPDNKKIGSIWGTQEEAENDSRIEDINKKIFNVLPKMVGSVNDLNQLIYGAVTGEEGPWYRRMKNTIDALEFKTSSEYDKNIGIKDTGKIKNFSDLLDTDNYDFSPSSIANSITNLGQTVLQFAATRGTMGIAGKGANASLKAGKITKEVAEKAMQLESKAKLFSSALMVNGSEALDNANKLGVVGQSGYSLALAAAAGVSVIDMLGGGVGEINKAFEKETGQNLIKNLVEGAIQDADGNITKEVTDGLFKTAYATAETVAKKAPKSLLRTAAEESGQEVSQNILSKFSEQIHDNLVSDDQSKYGTEMFSPQSVAEYLNDAFGGLIGGAQGHVLSKVLKKKESEEEKSKTIMSAISSGNENELKTQLYAARKSGQINEDDLQKGLFKIDRFIEYEEATKDRGLDPENRRKIFDLTYEKANVNTGIEHLEENNVDGINDGEIKFRKDHVKEIDGEIDEIFKGAEEKEEKEEEPITKAVKDFKFNKKEFGKEEKDVPSFNVNEMSPDEFEELDPVDKFHAIWQATNNNDKFFKPKELAGTLEIPIGRSAKINVGGKLIDLASSDQDREVVRNGEKVYPNEVLRQYNNEPVTIRPTKQGHYKTLSVFDKDGHIIKNLDGESYLIRASEKGYGRPKYNSSEFIHPEHIDEYEKGSEGLIKVADFETRNLGREFEGETESPEAKEILRKSIINPHTSWKHGEKYIDFAERAIETYKRWLNKAKDKSLIVTHSPVISLINQWEKQGRPKNLNELDFKALSEAKVHPEEISEHTSDKGKIYLVRTSQGANINDAGDKKFKLRTEPLTPEGEQTAIKVGQALKPLGITDVISSTLKRAKDTAIIIKKTIDGEPQEKKPKNPIVNPNNIAKFDKRNGNTKENTVKRKTSGTSESVSEKSASSSKTAQSKRSGNTLSKERRKIKSPLHLKALSIEVFTPYDLAQQYFIRKGNVSPEVIRNLFKGSSKEIQHRISLVKNGAPNSEQIGELLVAENENLNFTDVDYKNAVEDVLRSFSSRSQMASDLIKRNSEKENYNESEEAINDAIKAAEKFGGQDVLENIIDESENLTEEEFKNISEDKKSFNDFIENGEDIFANGDEPRFQKPQKESQQKAEQEIVDKVINHLKKANPKLSITYDNALKAAGMAQGNKIKINPFYAGTDTPIHEVAHILIDSIGGLNNRIVAKAVGQLKPTKLWEETVKRYSDKNGVLELSEEGMAKEVLAEAIGREGSNIFDTEVKKTYFRTLLDYIFDRIKTVFGINRNIAKSLAKQVLSGGVYNEAKKTSQQNQNINPSQLKNNPNFKKWFGNSKVVDENGDPLVVYHGTRSVFNIFKPSKKTGNQGEADQVEGMYFTDNVEGASWYSLNHNDERYLKKVYLSIQNPFVIKNYKQLKEKLNINLLADVNKTLKELGYDGIIMESGFYSNGGPYKLFLTLESNQIKSIDNNGIFNENNNNIYLQKIKEEKKKISYKEKTHKIANKIVDTKDLEGYTNEQLIEIYNRLISDKEFSSKKELKEAGKRIAYVLFRNRKIELNEKFGDKFVEAQANKTDLSWKDVRLKVLSHVTENFPELQELSKYYDKAVSEMQEERYDKKSKLESLGKEVIKEGNKELGLIGKAINYFSSNNAKYFDYLDNNGKMLTVSESETKGLSEAKIKFLKFMRELLAERQELESNEDIYNSDLEVLKTNKEFQEAFKSEGALTAFNNYLGKGYQIGDVRIEHTVSGTTEKKIDSLNNIQKELQEYAKKGRKEQMSSLLKTLKYTFKARKQFSKGVNADEEINPLNTFQSGDFQLNPKGELTSKYDKPYKGESYSKDFYRAALEYIDDTMHVKHMGKVLPIVNSIDWLNREGYGEHMKKPNVVKYLDSWRKLHLFKEREVTDPYLDSSLRFLRFFTSAISYAFNIPAAGINLFIGVYNNWRSETSKEVAVGHSRLYGNLSSHNVKKGLGLVNPYAFDILKKYQIINFDFDSNPKLFAGKLFDMLAYGATRFGEFNIQGSLALGLMKEEYNSFEYNDKGELVVKKGIDEKLLKQRINEIKNRISDIQGKYSEKDRRNILRGELGKTAFQFKIWLPDFWKERFGEEYIIRDNKTHRGSWRVFTGDALKDLKADIKEKGVKAIWNNKDAMANLKGALLVAFLMTLKYQDDDDKEARRKSLSLDNALGNILFIFDPSQLKFTIQQPVAGIGTLTKFAKTLEDLIKYDADKLEKDAKKLIPYRKTAQSIEEIFGE